jgi:isoleucyl-tRNA synthetase
MLEFKKIEEEILKFWEEHKIYEKSKKKNEKGKKFYFLQGPPYTSGKLHIGHAWNNSLKDMIMRFKRLNGFNVWDRAGYDMHGLPTENAVQKKLGFKTKEEILKYGVDKFVKDCMSFSKEHMGLMNKDLERFGIWMDFKDPYMPLTKEFISGQWKFFKKADEQKRLYKGSKVMHWDAETETALAKHELEYETLKEDSIFLKFKKKGTDNEYFIVWTTTPWTILYNLAIMANPDVDYVKIKVDDEYWIMARDLSGIFLSSIVGKKFEIFEEFSGRDLEGQEYEHFLSEEMPVYNELKKRYPKMHTIILSEKYVDTTSGSGLVHCAPGCGPEDEEAARPYNIEGYNSLNERGEVTEGKFVGWVAKRDDKKFIAYFKEKGNLIAVTPVEHEYPHSWRSHKPVIFRTTEQWFLKTTDLVDNLLKFNKKVHWVPKKAGESYDRWAENLKENSVTRQRFWGCPVPIWVNKKDPQDYLVVGSVEELEKLAKKKFDDLSLHKPWIDHVIIKKQGKEYKRIDDVCDVWIDSGTASWNCLYNDEKLIKKWFPADLVLEATEQTRLWFSLLQICSSIVFNKSCYENVYVHGMILDFQGTKMSKSIGNIISPYEVVDKYSSDIFRYYICEITAGENINFNWEDIKQKQRNLLILWNLHKLLIDMKKNTKKGKEGITERYIFSRMNSSINNVTKLFDDYSLDKTISEIEKLFLDLSRVYIQFNRERSDEKIVYETFKEVYVECLKMFSTICPLITEAIWQELRKEKIVEEESVHLAKWPITDAKKTNKKLEEGFENALQVVEAGLAARDKVQIGLKWPLAKATVFCEKIISKELVDLILVQLNVKNIQIEKGKLSVELDTKLTPDLEEEGYAREISRKVQAARKNAGLSKGDKIDLAIAVDLDLKNQEKFIKERTDAEKIIISGNISGNYKHTEESTIKDKKIKILFSKL